MRGVIDVAPGATTTHSNGFRFGFYMDIADQREIDDQTDLCALLLTFKSFLSAQRFC